MKTIFKLFLCAILVAACATAWSNVSFAEESAIKRTIIEEPVGSKALESICPKTLMRENCLGCHIAPSFKLKPDQERDPFEAYAPPYGTSWHIENNQKILVHDIIDDQIGPGSAKNLVKALEYAERHKTGKLVVKILSPGGSVFHAWRMIGYIERYQQQGMIIETRCEGIAASAAAILFASGSNGFRKISPESQLMFHELWTFKFLSIDTPSSSEDKAQVLRHIQDTGNLWLEKHSKITKEEWDELMKRKDFWMNGKQAVEEYGIADGYL